MGAVRRTVIGYRELIEKMTIHRSSLDDRIIEMIKFYIYTKATDEDGDKEIKIYFHKKEKDRLVFYIEGLEKDNIGISKIEQAVYNKIEREIDQKQEQKPYSSFLDPPYVSINKIYRED